MKNTATRKHQRRLQRRQAGRATAEEELKTMEEASEENNERIPVHKGETDTAILLPLELDDVAHEHVCDDTSCA